MSISAKKSLPEDSYPKTFYAFLLTSITVISLGSVIFLNSEADDSNQVVLIQYSPPTITNLTYGVSATSDVQTLNLANLGDGSSAEGSRFTSVITATVNDENGCSVVDNPFNDYELKLYRRSSGVGESDGGACNFTNGTSCYIGDTARLILGSCLNTTTYAITWPVETFYYIDPTDSGDYSHQDWGARLRVTDDVAQTVTATDVFEVDTLLALDVTSLTDFGTLSLGSDSNSVGLLIKNTGNTTEDYAVGYNQSFQCTSSSFNGSQVKITQYSEDPIAGATAMGAVTNETVVNATIAKATTMATSATDPLYAYLSIPNNAAVGGSCSNTATYTAINNGWVGI